MFWAAVKSTWCIFPSYGQLAPACIFRGVDAKAPVEAGL